MKQNSPETHPGEMFCLSVSTISYRNKSQAGLRILCNVKDLQIIVREAQGLEGTNCGLEKIALMSEETKDNVTLQGCRFSKGKH